MIRSYQRGLPPPCSCCRPAAADDQAVGSARSSRHRAGGDTRPRIASPCRPRASSGTGGRDPRRSCRPTPRPRRGHPAPRSGLPGRWGISRSRWAWPDGEVVVSTRNTTDASSPLAPCTVITRTSSREISMSRFTSVWAARSQAMKPLQRCRRLALIARARASEEFVERIIGLVAKPAQACAPGRRRRRAARHRTRTASPA